MSEIDYDLALWRSVVHPVFGRLPSLSADIICAWPPAWHVLLARSAFEDVVKTVVAEQAPLALLINSAAYRYNF